MVVSALLRRDKPPVLLKLRSSAGLIVTTASFAVFTDIFLYAVIVPVVPFSLISRAGIEQDKVQYWVSISLAVYGAALLVSSPIWGYLADRIRNRKIPMLFGLILLSASTIFLCVSRGIVMFLVGRVLQGLSAALTWTVGLALVVDTVDAKHVGMAMGWIGAATSLGILLAPLLGGVVYEKGGYYSVFAMCFGLLAVDIVLRLSIIEVKDARKWLGPEEGLVVETRHEPKALDVRAGQPGDVQAVLEPESTDSEKGSVPSPAIPQETITPEGHDRPTHTNTDPKTSSSAFGPMLQLLRNPRLLAALWGTLVLAIIQTSLDSTLPLLVKTLFHWNSVGAGLIFLPPILPSILGPLAGMLSDKYGPKWFAAVGYALATPFLVCLRFVNEDSMSHKVMLCGLLAGLGVAIVGVFGPVMAEITWAVVGDDGGDEESKSAAPYAQAYGLYNVAFSGGAMLGPIVGGMIRDEAGWPTVGWVLGLFTGVTAITQMIWVGGPLKLGKKKV